MSKSLHKLHKSERSPPVRKDHVMKKPMIASSMHIPPRNSSILPSEMKRGHLMVSGKNIHSSRMRSIASSSYRPMSHHVQRSPSPHEREHGLKRPKYDMRKDSTSVERSVSPPSHRRRSYSNDRYSGGKARFTPSPSKKKIYRYESDDSPVRRNNLPVHGGRDHHHRDMSADLSGDSSGHSNFDHPNHGRRGPPPSRSAPPKPAYADERYRSPPSKIKRPHVTLNERFSSVVDNNRTEPRVKYNQEDLEKITIDILRNLKPASPTVRKIVNPGNVKLVRRSNEGHRPMFDREEIKQASRDLREDAYYEKKSSAPGFSHHQRDLENYEVTKRRTDSHHHVSSIPSRNLTDRWQNSDGPKGLERDGRGYEPIPMKKSFTDSRSKSGDRDFRSERYTVRDTNYSRTEYREPTTRRLISPPVSPRPSMRKENTIIDARQRINARLSRDSLTPEPRSHYSMPQKRYLDETSLRSTKHYERSHSPDIPPRKWPRRSLSRSRERSIPMFSRGPQKFAGKPWPDKRDSPPSRDNSYYHHSNYEDSYRGRGSSRMFRSPRGGFRSRGSRGGFSSRGPYRGSVVPRGRGGMRSSYH